MQVVRPVTSIFQQPWWLDAVAPGRWDMVEVRSNGTDLDAWMPFVMRIDSLGVKVIDMPQLTMTLGPWTAPGDGEHPRRELAREQELLGELADALPEVDLFRQRFAPSVTAPLAFKQRGYTLEVAYTYVISDLTDEDELWRRLSPDRRKKVKRAAKRLQVEPTDDLDLFLRLNRMTYERQGLAPPYSDEYVRRIDAACVANDAREILVARDEADNVHAAGYVVFDEHATFALMSGSDPAYRRFGAGGLLMWERIRRAAKRSQVFDFEGGTSPNVAAFVRTFGGDLVPYVVATKSSARWQAAELARSQAKLGAARASSLAARLRRQTADDAGGT